VRAEFSLARLQWRGQLAVLVAFAGAAAIAFWYAIDLPGQARITAAALELSELQRRTAASRDDTPRLKELREKVMALQAAGRDPGPTNPGEPDVVELLRVLHEHATDAGLFVRAFRPKPGSDRQPAADPSIGLELEGTYHDFGTFLDRLRALTRPIFVTGFSLRAQQSPATDGNIDILCTISSSWPAAPGASNGFVPASGEVSGSAYAYEPAGRRDPFVGSIEQDAVIPIARTIQDSRPEGLRGLKVEEAVVKGIVRNREAWIALIGSPVGRTYSIRAGDRLLDGSVRAVTHGAVVFVQDADVAASRPAPREVRKPLRSEEK
jgi:type IV pilus assembly protein PilO